MKKKVKKQLGLIGRNLEHSFSLEFFKKKFLSQGIVEWNYNLFSINEINKFPELIKKVSNLVGLNVTIPYKEIIIEYLDELSPEAKEISAVNTIFIKGKKLIGYNTDVNGFWKSLVPLLKKQDQKALVLGSGGSSKAICYVLKKLNIEYLIVSRNPNENSSISYSNLDKEIISEYKLIVNTTPLGMFPETEKCPDIPYHYLNENHLLYDLIYNPSTTLFLDKGIEKGCRVKNGLEMLHIQAEESWKIWNA